MLKTIWKTRETVQIVKKKKKYTIKNFPAFLHITNNVKEVRYLVIDIYTLIWLYIRPIHPTIPASLIYKVKVFGHQDAIDYQFLYVAY